MIPKFIKSGQRIKKRLTFIISGGGTGGHIYPAIAIANELKFRFPSCRILFVGAKGKMEMQKVPQAGYTIKGLWISGIQRKLSWRNLILPFKLIHSSLKARRIIKKIQPDVVIGTGGFASGTVLFMATRMKIPTLIQEQNSFPGITNKVLAKKVQTICVAYNGLEKFFPKDKIVFTGNPVRQDLLNQNENKNQAIKYFNLQENKKTLLVLGGSLGARRINQLIESQIEFITKQNIQIIWQCGTLYLEEYQKYNQIENVHVRAFIDRMDLAYSCADFIISRSGASSVSELSIVGKPTIFIPSPNVAEDHQTKNAIADKNAAILITESELSDTFEPIFSQLISDTQLQKELSQNFKKLAKPNATKEIVNEITKFIERKST